MDNRTLTPDEEKQGLSTLHLIWRYGPLIFWIVFIWFGSTSRFSALNTSAVIRPVLIWFFPNLSDVEAAEVHFLIRKVAHFTEYAILAYLARRAFVTSSHAVVRQHWLQLGLLLVVICALLDEFHQSFVSSRTPSIYDSAIDVAGGLTVLLIYKFYDKRAAKRRTLVV
jgi:VanZ family protein